MEDGYQADVQRIASVGDGFAAQQGTPSTLAGTLQGAQAVNAGLDQGVSVTARIQLLVGDLVTALNGLTTGLQQDASLLRKQAQDYQTIHSTTRDAIARFRQSSLPNLPGSR